MARDRQTIIEDAVLFTQFGQPDYSLTFIPEEMLHPEQVRLLAARAGGQLEIIGERDYVVIEDSTGLISDAVKFELKSSAYEKILNGQQVVREQYWAPSKINSSNKSLEQVGGRF